MNRATLRIAAGLVACCYWPVVCCQAWQSVDTDGEKLQAAGFVVQTGRHLKLVTDARDREDIAEFLAVFDVAVAQWCDRFGVEPRRADQWKMTGYVMVDRQRFVDAGLLPDDLPPFPAGFQRDHQMWLYVQPGNYYTRHLLLHEGTHAFMQQFLGDYGPPWYAEGMAELLAVHRWHEGNLKLNYQIRERDEVPWWGRVKAVRQERDQRRALALDEVLMMPDVSFRQVEAYGWAWLACQFFDRHPWTGSAFQQLPGNVGETHEGFNRGFRQTIQEGPGSWRKLERDWNNFIDEVEYGYDVTAAATSAASARSLEDRTEIQVDSRLGWQTTGITIRAGQEYQIDCQGMFQVRHDGQSWPCDASGVTIEYYRGRPLGQLVAAVQVPDNDRLEPRNWLAIDVSTVTVFEQTGELVLRINESPAGLSDNDGDLTVTIRPAAD